MVQGRRDRALWTLVRKAPLPETEKVSGFSCVDYERMLIYCESGNKYMYDIPDRTVALANLRLVKQ
jgi:hypothetical protein